MKLLSWNAHSLTPTKVVELLNFAYERDITILAVAETWRDFDDRYLYRGHQVHSIPCSNGRRGLAVFVRHRTCKSQVVHRIFHEQILLQHISISTSTDIFDIIQVYMPYGSSSIGAELCQNYLIQLPVQRPTIVMGDFNARLPMHGSSNRAGNVLRRFLQSSIFHRITPDVDKSTFSNGETSSIIDHVLGNTAVQPFQISVRVHMDHLDSDHYPLLVYYDGAMINKSLIPSTNIDRLTRYLHGKIVSRRRKSWTQSNPIEIDRDAAWFHEQCLQGYSQFTTLKDSSFKPQSFAFTSELRRLKRQRNRFR